MASQEVSKQELDSLHRNGKTRLVTSKRYLVLLVAAIVLTSILQLMRPSPRLYKTQGLPFEFGNVWLPFVSNVPLW